MSRPEALAEMAKTLQPLNAHAGEPIARAGTVSDWIRDGFLPFIRRQWKASTASTSGDRIRTHLIADFQSLPLDSVTRDLLQEYLERKAAEGHSFSVVDHLRWDLRAIFRLAVQDRVLGSSPAELLYTPGAAHRPSRQVLAAGQVQTILRVLDLREQLIVQLALFSGMRPGEILALQWKHVAPDHVQVCQRLYRGKLDRVISKNSISFTYLVESCFAHRVTRFRMRASIDKLCFLDEVQSGHNVAGVGPSPRAISFHRSDGGNVSLRTVTGQPCRAVS